MAKEFTTVAQGAMPLRATPGAGMCPTITIEPALPRRLRRRQDGVGLDLLRELELSCETAVGLP
jgi:hypothetical protein